MVVSRKLPIPPAPSPASRTPSSQPLSRAMKAKADQLPATRPTPPSETDKELASKAKAKRQQKENRKPSRSWLSHRLFTLLLGLFSVYAFVVCPTDHPRTSSVCRSLDLYRSHVLDPYIVPPIRVLLKHTSPHLAPIKPYVAPAVTYTRTEVVPRVSSFLSFSSRQFRSHVLPTYNYYVVHLLWETRIKPGYYYYVYPRVFPYVRPYVLYHRIYIAPIVRNTYARVAAGYARVAVGYARFAAGYTRVSPYITRANAASRAVYKIGKTYTSNAYKTAKPYVVTAYVRARPGVLAVSGTFRLYALQLVRKATDARREFVDPHMRRIWEKIGESKTTTLTTSAPSLTSEKVISTTREIPVLATKGAQETPTVEEAVAVSATPKTQETASSIPTSSPTFAPSVPQVTPKETKSNFITTNPHSLALEDSGEVQRERTVNVSPQVTESETEDLHPSVVSSIPTTEPESEATASIIPASPHASKSSENRNSNNLDDGELDDFLKDIGLENGADVNSSSSQESSVQAPLSDANTASSSSSPEFKAEEETEEERLKNIAVKRAELIARRDKWERELKELVKSVEGEVRDVLDEIRRKAVKELDGYGIGRDVRQDGDGDNHKAKKRGVVGVVEMEAERFIKGLEGYLRNAEGRVKTFLGDDSGVKVKEERQKWDRVLDKTEERFSEKVKDIQSELHGWYVAIRGQESDKVAKAVEKVKLFAEKAQGDVGIDYAWLEDVTYEDWQTYHDLMRISENFTTLAHALHTGNHSAPIAANAEPVEDVLLQSLNKIERDVSDLIDGFVALVREVEGRGRKVFEEVLMARTDKKIISGEEGKERASILPIEPTATVLPLPVDGLGEGVEQLFIGRSKEEVEERLRGVSVESTTDER